MAARILVVEDDKQYREILKEKLEAEGFIVLAAEDGQHGISLLQKSEIQLILLDLNLPQMDGQEFFYHIKYTLKKEIPVLILTNMTAASYSPEVKEYLVKANTNLNEIVKKIRQHLRA